VVCTGSAQSALYQQGCYYANGEFIQVHPTCIPGEDKLRLMSESARGEGGRVWVPRTGDKRDPKSIPEKERWYFLEEWYPKYGNLVPRDVATRAIFKVVYENNLGIDGKPMVYLDLTHIDAKTLDRKLEGILEIYEKFVGDDPRDVPMKIFPGMHYTMGGLWVDYKQATNIPGIYAAGEAEYQYHGANRWARTRWCRASLEASSPARQPCSTRRICKPRPIPTVTSKPSANASRKSTTA
jgi:succinate dehydrogenase / fumarate reductase flavoprotein subunit